MTSIAATPIIAPRPLKRSALAVNGPTIWLAGMDDGSLVYVALPWSDGMKLAAGIQVNLQMFSTEKSQTVHMAARTEKCTYQGRRWQRETRTQRSAPAIVNKYEQYACSCRQ